MDKERHREIPAATGEFSNMDLLMENVRRFPVLRKEEEVDLFQRIEAGRITQTSIEAANGNLSSQDKEKLLVQVADGEQAWKRVILSNQRLVISIAKRHQGRGLPLEDLFQSGIKGLMRAAEDFDYRRGNKFSTYATNWIRQTIQRDAAETGRTIRIPIHTQDRLAEILKVSEGLTREFDRKPTITELSQSIKMPQKRIHDLLMAGPAPLSLDAPTGEEGEGTLGEVIPSNGHGNPQQNLEREMLLQHTKELLSQLNPREERVIRMRYGLDGPSLKLHEVAEKMGITRERVRQIQENALSKMRGPAYMRGLSDFLN
jgi:RNA polymerase primary sigma factor